MRFGTGVVLGLRRETCGICVSVDHGLGGRGDEPKQARVVSCLDVSVYSRLGPDSYLEFFGLTDDYFGSFRSGQCGTLFCTTFVF